jgi:hypothetical protein
MYTNPSRRQLTELSARVQPSQHHPAAILLSFRAQRDLNVHFYDACDAQNFVAIAKERAHG